MDAINPAEDRAISKSILLELNYSGPERRGGAAPGLVRLLARVLDEIDYGLLLLGADGKVVHVNHAATTELMAETSGLEIKGERLRCSEAADHAKLSEALELAHKQGRRSMLRMGAMDASALSIVPLPVPLSRDCDGHAVLVTMQRNRIVETLSVSAFARAHALSQREEQVLALLCDGMRAADIATHLEVSQATVRSHVHNLKTKTGCNSMLDLVKQVAVLPPMVETLNRNR